VSSSGLGNEDLARQRHMLFHIMGSSSFLRVAVFGISRSERAFLSCL
jgi:hypothetical protein